MATIVYIDGFNLYYGAVKGTANKWLDLEVLCRRLLPKDNLVKIRYFTALVAIRPSDPQQPARQQAYLRALATLADRTQILFFTCHQHLVELVRATLPGAAIVELGA